MQIKLLFVVVVVVLVAKPKSQCVCFRHVLNCETQINVFK